MVTTISVRPARVIKLNNNKIKKKKKKPKRAELNTVQPNAYQIPKSWILGSFGERITEQKNSRHTSDFHAVFCKIDTRQSAAHKANSTVVQNQ